LKENTVGLEVEISHTHKENTTPEVEISHTHKENTTPLGWVGG